MLINKIKSFYSAEHSNKISGLAAGIVWAGCLVKIPFFEEGGRALALQAVIDSSLSTTKG